MEHLDHRTALKTDEKTMVIGLENELDRVLMKPIENISRDPKTIAQGNGKSETVMDSIDSTIQPWSLKTCQHSCMELEDLPAFLPLKNFTPEQFATIRNGDRFNVDGRTMHIRFEKEYIPGLRSLKVIKGSD